MGYITAWQEANIEQLLALIKEDAIITMPPLSLWYRGIDAIREFIRRGPLSDTHWGGEWTLKPATHNNQPAFAMYFKPMGHDSFEPFAINTLSIDGDKIARIDFFLVSSHNISMKDAPNWFDYLET